MIEIDILKNLHTAGGTMDLSINTSFPTGSFVCLYGPSGSGKTSTLKILAGLLRPEKGRIVMDGETWFSDDSKIDLSTQKRNIGFVFQDYALFPNMTVRENLAYALDKKSEPKMVDVLLEMMELGELHSRKPNTLSGGQKQRVALARALVRKPQLLLLDEPLAALDYTIRLKLQDYLQQIHREFGLTTILVSHDIAEISKLSDLVISLDNGSVKEIGSPAELFIKQQISGKFRFVGEVLQVEVQEVVNVVSVLVQNQVVKVIARKAEIKGLKPGDKVLLASKAFNPVIYKIE